jgi:hypothetical protein
LRGRRSCADDEFASVFDHFLTPCQIVNGRDCCSSIWQGRNVGLEIDSTHRTSADVAARYAARTFLPASIIGLCHRLFSPLDPDEADWSLARVADGDGVAADSPIAALRLRIVKLRVGGGRVNETEALALMILAWNAHRAGGTRSKLQMPKGGLTPRTSRSRSDLGPLTTASVS